MHALVFLCCSLVLGVTHVYSVTVTTPAMQRKIAGESCRFRWGVTGNFATYSIKFLSTGSSLGPNTNQTSDSVKGLITLFIWNIQLSDAGYYSLSFDNGPSSSIAVLFVYTNPYSNAVLTVGRNTIFQGDKIELNCSGTSYSLPVSDRPKMYYFWYTSGLGNFRNISSGPAVLQNGDDVPEYSIKNDGSTLVIASAQYTANGWIVCWVQEEGSPYKSNMNYNVYLTIYGKPNAYSFNPASRKFNAVLNSYVNLNFYYQANPPLTSYTNWSFENASGSTVNYPVESNPLTNSFFSLSFYPNSNGNVSITLTNGNGSTTVTFQILPQGVPDTPSNFSVQYWTHSLISLQWRCMWFNGAQQTVSIRLTDVASNVEVETRNKLLDNNCYGSRYSTLFQGNIQPARSYVASIWSTNSLGSSDIVNLTLITPKRVIFDVSPSNIFIVETVATINFRLLDSIITLIRLNVTCCVEITADCHNKSYILANTDNQIVYDILPSGTEYVFDFNVFDTDGYTYEYILALVKGVRVSRVPTTEFTTPTAYIPNDFTTPPCVCKYNETSAASDSYDNGNPLLIPVIVLAVLLGVAVLVLLGCCIGLLVSKGRRNNSQQVSTAARTTVPRRTNAAVRETADSFAEDNYEPVVDMNRSKNNVYYKTLDGTLSNDEQTPGAWHTGRPFESGNDDNISQSPYMNPDELYYKKANETLDRPKKSRYQ